MKLGADPKKVAILAGLTGIAGYLFYANVFSSPSTEPAVTRAKPTQAAAKAPAGSSAVVQNVAPRPGGTQANGRRGDFRPPYRSKAPTDLSAIDPKLRLDLLAKVQAVEVGSGERNLFAYGRPEPVNVAKLHEVPPIVPKPGDPGRNPNNPNAGGPATPPPPPAITLKYYGYIAQRADGHKRAFFLDGDDILVASEGDLMKRRYKVVRIGVNSAVVEDTQFNNQQTLPLAEEAG